MPLEYWGFFSSIDFLLWFWSAFHAWKYMTRDAHIYVYKALGSQCSQSLQKYIDIDRNISRVLCEWTESLFVYMDVTAICQPINTFFKNQPASLSMKYNGWWRTGSWTVIPVDPGERLVFLPTNQPRMGVGATSFLKTTGSGWLPPETSWRLSHEKPVRGGGLHLSWEYDKGLYHNLCRYLSSWLYTNIHVCWSNRPSNFSWSTLPFFWVKSPNPVA